MFASPQQVAKVKVPVSYVRVAHAKMVTELALQALSDASSDRVLRRFDSIAKVVVAFRCDFPWASFMPMVVTRAP